MKKTVFNKRTALRFTQFSRKSYALFACMGKEVLVGVLAVSSLTHAKAEGISTDVALAIDSLQRKEVKLDEVVVTGSRAPLTELQLAKIVTVITRDDIQRAAGAGSVSDVLKQVSGVDVRQRGGFGVQTDISMRGGNFDHITILLNGSNISSPHTGHLSADFPIDLSDIERIEVLEGSASRVHGSSAFNGVVNIITRQKTDHVADVHVAGGSYGYANAGASVYADAGNFYTNVSGGYSRSDGATENSAFESSRFYWHGGLSGKDYKVDAQFGYSYKPYEANTFYGAASTDQWESNERYIASINGNVRLGKLNVQPRAYFNRWYDHYQWHRNSSVGENFHRVDAAGGAINAFFETAIGKTSIGGELRRESIWSTRLGVLQDAYKWKNSGGHDGSDDVKYKYHDGRTVSSAFLEHNILLNKWTFSLGATAIRTRLTGFGVYPGIDIAYRPTDAWKLFASWNTGMRLPTFTDLYYSGANIEGNSQLAAEKTSEFQIGVRHSRKGFIADAQLFYSHKKDMIDWVVYQEAADNIFHSVNFKMNSFGAETNVSLLPKELFGAQFPLRKLTARYSYIHQNSDYGVTVLQSKYAMDYLRHKVNLSADIDVWRKLSLNINWRWQDRIGSNNPSYALLDARLSWNTKRYSIYLDGSNVLNKTYFDYVSVPQPGIVVLGGVKLRI